MHALEAHHGTRSRLDSADLEAAAEAARQPEANPKGLEHARLVAQPVLGWLEPLEALGRGFDSGQRQLEDDTLRPALQRLDSDALARLRAPDAER